MDFRIKGSRMPQILMLCGVLTLFLVSGHCVTNVLGAPAAEAQVDFKEIQIGPHPGEKELLLLRGPDSRQQVVVTGVLADGKLQDLTRNVTYAIAHQDIASISNDGYLTPLKDGQTQLTVTAKNGKTASIPVTIQGIASPEAINFKNQVVPIFTKLTCNSGGCHGKSTGQNGFRLSLLGFEPDFDYQTLVLESRGRRVFASTVDRS
ncbi:MAG: Ig-like domain-containing protein, partial [Planctomycetota bacterium]